MATRAKRLRLAGGFRWVCTGDAVCPSSAGTPRRCSLPRTIPTHLDHFRGLGVRLFRLSVYNFYADPKLGRFGAEPDQFVAAVVLAATERDMEGNLVTRIGRRGRDFR